MSRPLPLNRKRANMATVFPTILRRGRRVRVTVGRLEPLRAVVLLAPGAEPELQGIMPRTLAKAYQDGFKGLLCCYRIKLVPVRWELAEGQQLPTLSAEFGLAKGVQS